MSVSILKPDCTWNVHVQSIILDVIAKLIDPDRRQVFWEILHRDLVTHQSPSALLDRFDRLGHSLDELEIIQELLKNYHVLAGDDGDEVLIPWLAFNIFPRLQETRDQLQTLETTIDMVSSKLTDFTQGLERTLASEDRHAKTGGCRNVQLRNLNAVLQEYKDAQIHGHDTNAPQSTSTTGGTSGSLNSDDRYKALTERIQALEEKVKEDQDRLEACPSNLVSTGSLKNARSQTMQDTVQKLPSGFEALSDASTSSTCTLTPASSVVNDPIEESNNTNHGDVAPVAPLNLRVFVHAKSYVVVNHDGMIFLDSPHCFLVKMHEDTPFKSLTDKLREDYGDMDLHRRSLPLRRISDRDTPASLKLGQNDKLMFANISNRVKTMDLTE
ncbi:hypothetical protein KCU65_g1193, partial [Aureobasidium melanogenum]